MKGVNTNADLAAIPLLLTELRTVLESPEAVDPVDAAKRASPKGYAQGKQRLADAGRWIEDAERELREAQGDGTRAGHLLAEVERVHGFVMYVGDRHDIKLDGTGPGIEAWRIIKETSATHTNLTGPSACTYKGPWYPGWTISN